MSARFFQSKFSTFALAFLTVCLCSSCGTQTKDQSSTTKITPEDGMHEESNSDDLTPTPLPQKKNCHLPPEQVGELKSFESLVKLINALPKPVTIACFVEALPRPLAVSATSSRLSAQPAIDEDDPRVFIFINDLIISFATDGIGAAMIEFSHLVTSSRSVKGEIAFPVTTLLPLTAAYDGVVATETSSRCVSCHTNEAPAAQKFPANAYASTAFRPTDRSIVSLQNLLAQAKLCKGIESERCDIFRALFRDAHIKEQNFPDGMPTQL